MSLANWGMKDKPSGNSGLTNETEPDTVASDKGASMASASSCSGKALGLVCFLFLRILRVSLSLNPYEMSVTIPRHSRMVRPGRTQYTEVVLPPQCVLSGAFL